MQLRLGKTDFSLDQPRVMGILNVTTDSFSDGGEFFSVDNAVKHALKMISGGADIIDIGGESTRPGATEISSPEEIDRVVPIITEIAGRNAKVAISIDTSRPEVMFAAVEAGATMINDVFALRRAGALEAAVELAVPVCLMHMQGEPANMQTRPHYDDLIGDIMGFLNDRLAVCKSAGIDPQQLIIDPGFGFGKTDEHNLRLLAGLSCFADMGHPLLVGLSRKRTLGNLTGRDVKERVAAGISAALLAVANGANIIRTHDVEEIVDAVKVREAVLEAGKLK